MGCGSSAQPKYEAKQEGGEKPKVAPGADEAKAADPKADAGAKPAAGTAAADSGALTPAPAVASSKPCLYYFPIAGRGELTRMIAAAGNVDMDEKSELLDKASHMSPGTLPCLEHGSLKISQSFAIEMYIANIAPAFQGLTKPQRAIDMQVMKIKEDFLSGYAKVFFAAKDDEKKIATIAADTAAVGDKWYPVLEGRLPATGFINGLQFPTAADFAVLSIAKGFMPFGALNLMGGYDPLKKYAKFAAHAERVAQHPSIKGYLEKSKSLDADPYGVRKKMGVEAPAAAAPAEAPAEKKAVVIAEPEPDEDDDENEMEMDEEEFERQVERRTVMESGAARKSRMAVSSEAVEMDPEWKAPVFDKTAEQEERLTKALSESFMFASLSGDDLVTVIKAFQEFPAKAGTTVITQGDEVVSDQPALYVFESGKLSVFKKGSEGSVFTYDTPGQYFGELALLYNDPRAATVIADEDCLLWSIDRNTFNYLVKDAARLAVKKRMSFLEEVPILKGLTAEEKATLSDVMNVKIVMKDQFVIKQGDVGREFFILESGKLEARKDGEKVLEYCAKDFFGELALLRDAPRAADVVATEMCKVLSLDSGSFKRIVGSLEDVMKERAAAYGEVTLPS